MIKLIESKQLYDTIERIRKLTHHVNRNKTSLDGKRKVGAQKGHKAWFFKIPKNVDKIITIKLKRCPNCKSEIKGHRRKTIKHQAVFCRDIIVTRKSLAVKDIRYLLCAHYCRKCKAYVNKKPKRMVGHSPYGLGMFVYATVKRIIFSMPYNKISTDIELMFSTRINPAATLLFVNRMAKENRDAHDDLLRQIKRCKVIHADETRWPINRVNWWVWIFTSEKEAVYILSKNRDAKVPLNVLSNFKGVLVCDFYSAYEKVKCKQQKCLVHVLRDFQKAIKKTPYDEELMLFIENFLSIFNPIFQKLREENPDYLCIKSQKVEVQKKLNDLIRREYLSEPVNTFKKRFQKHLQRMIRFMSDPENISWNNNQAERDLRPLCVQRKISGAMRSSNDSEKYLTLFSICRTCEKRNINFMKFLLSRRKKIPNRPIKSLMK